MDLGGNVVRFQRRSHLARELLGVPRPGRQHDIINVVAILGNSEIHLLGIHKKLSFGVVELGGQLLEVLAAVDTLVPRTLDASEDAFQRPVNSVLELEEHLGDLSDEVVGDESGVGVESRVEIW